MSLLGEDRIEDLLIEREEEARAEERALLGMTVSEIAAARSCSREGARALLLAARRRQDAAADAAWRAAGAVDVRDWLAARREGRA